MLSNGKQQRAEDVVFHRNLTFLAEAQALCAHTPVHIAPSGDTPWRYIVNYTDASEKQYTQECGIERLVHVVEDAVELSGYRKRLEESFIDRIIEEYLGRIGEVLRKIAQEKVGVLAQATEQQVL